MWDSTEHIFLIDFSRNGCTPSPDIEDTNFLLSRPPWNSNQFWNKLLDGIHKLFTFSYWSSFDLLIQNEFPYSNECAKYIYYYLPFNRTDRVKTARLSLYLGLSLYYTPSWWHNCINWISRPAFDLQGISKKSIPQNWIYCMMAQLSQTRPYNVKLLFFSLYATTSELFLFTYELFTFGRSFSPLLLPL